MVLQFLIFVAGLAVLYYGAEILVKGTVGLVLRYGVRPLIAGSTIVALGTSMPEFIFYLLAVASGEDGLALGNVVGSNICNMGLVLGISALIRPLRVERATITKVYPFMMGVLALFFLASLDGMITWIDGLLFLAMLAGMFLLLRWISRQTGSPPPLNLAGQYEPLAGETRPGREGTPKAGQEMSLWKQAGLLVGGTLLLSMGAWLMVYAAVNVAETLRVDPVVIGLTVVAIGTSLPEFAASVVSAMKREAEISVGNVLGSNILNVLFVVGPVSLFRPLPVGTDVLWVHFPIMIGFGVLLLPMAWSRFTLSRKEGGALTIGFLAYLIYLIARL